MMHIYINSNHNFPPSRRARKRRVIDSPQTIQEKRQAYLNEIMPGLNQTLQWTVVFPYERKSYRYTLATFIFLYSIYFIGIGVTMAVTPSIKVLVSVCAPVVVPETVIKLKEQH